jgi:hypothetical protein
MLFLLVTPHWGSAIKLEPTGFSVGFRGLSHWVGFFYKTILAK